MTRSEALAATPEAPAARYGAFSAETVRRERELLQRYHAKDFRGLLKETHVLLVGVVRLMKNTHPETRLRGYVVSSLGSLLEQVSSLVLRMRNVYDEVGLVNTVAPLQLRRNNNHVAAATASDSKGDNE